MLLEQFTLSLNHFHRKSNLVKSWQREEDPMQKRLVRQFILFLAALFAWTAVILLVSPK